jgi:hypothetical protein
MNKEPFLNEEKKRSCFKRSCFKFPRAENRALTKIFYFNFLITQYLIYAPLSVFYESLRSA